MIVRTTGFGQTGPYSHLPGFGTLAESISGFAHINGWPDRPPALPPLALGDGIAALTGCSAAMFALWWREHGGEGKGQVIDLSIYEPLFWVLGPQALVYDQLGIVQGRTGNRAPFTAPRNAYLTKDGRWLGLSASAQSIAERVMRIVGRPDLIEEPWFADHMGRIEHVDELDEIIQGWIGAADDGGGAGRVRRRRGRDRPDLLDRGHRRGPAVPRARDDRAGAAPEARLCAHAERHPPAVGHAGTDPASGTGDRGAQRGRLLP